MGVEEILVHIGGPSSTKDDQRFRAMASAYDRFEPAKSFPLTGESDISQQPAQTRSPVVVTSSLRAMSGNDECNSVAVPRTEEALTRAQRPGERSTGPSGPFKIIEYIENTPLAVAALESQLLTSSLVVSSVVSSPLAQRSSKQNDVTVDDTTESESFHTPHSSRNASTKDGSSLARVDGSKSTTAGSPKPYQSPLMQQQSSPSAQKATTAVHSVPEKTLKSLESMPAVIISPSPPASLLPAPTTQITPPLRQLAENPDLSVRFKPTFTSRHLRPLERGYWRIDSNVWDHKVQVDFWSYLEDFLGSGRAGWGVSAYREWTGDGTDPENGENVNPAATRGLEQRTESDMPESLGVVRIYCWGEIVEHVYLVAFVASWSKVKLSKAQWIDADGEVIVQMP